MMGPNDTVGVTCRPTYGTDLGARHEFQGATAPYVPGSYVPVRSVKHGILRNVNRYTTTITRTFPTVLHH